MISHNSNVTVGNIDYSLYTRRIALEDYCHNKRMDILAYTLVKLHYLETQAKIGKFPATQNPFNQENFF